MPLTLHYNKIIKLQSVPEYTVQCAFFANFAFRMLLAVNKEIL